MDVLELVLLTSCHSLPDRCVLLINMCYRGYPLNDIYLALQFIHLAAEWCSVSFVPGFVDSLRPESCFLRIYRPESFFFKETQAGVLEVFAHDSSCAKIVSA